MPDIRNFFGGKPASAAPAKTPKKGDSATKQSRGKRKIVDEDEDDELIEIPKPATPKKPTPKKSTKKASSPAGEATTSTEYFATSNKNKPNRSTAASSKPSKSTPRATPTKANGTSTKNTPKSASIKNGRASARHKKTVTYDDEADEDLLEVAHLDDDPDAGDDVFNSEFKKGGKGFGDDYEESEEDEEVVKPKRASGRKGRQETLSKNKKQLASDEDIDMKDTNPDDDFIVPDDDEEVVEDKPAKGRKAKANTSRKRKSAVLDEDEEDATPKKGKGSKASPTKASPAKKSKQADVPESEEVKAIYDSIPLVRPPTPPSTAEPKKFQYGNHTNSGPAPAQGSKEIPTGAPNCLAGLTFVFTGLLDSIDRSVAQELVKRYGGKVTGAPSKNTSFVVLGNDAGPKKLETIRKNNLKTINEDGLFELIRKLPANGGDSKAAAKYEEKAQKEAEKVKQMAEEIEREERRAGGAGGAGTNSKSAAVGAAKGKQSTAAANESRLWTVKYAPTQTSQICGNKAQVEKLQRWLKAFPKNQRTGFKLAGPDGSGTYRAVIIHGPPGIGKTTAAHLVAKLEGYDIVESNASDTRSKKLVESGLKGVLSTTSLLGYFAGDGQSVQESKKKLVLIMDEVDGMSAGDRGGVGALAAVCKKSQIPMILICNDRRLPKMKPFDFVTYALPFHRPTTDQIRSRIMTIAYREGLKMPAPVIDALIEGSGADIRQIVNMVSTAKLDQTAMDFDKSKQMSKAWEKHVILKPWDINSKILGGGMFTPSSKATLNDKIELYFNDHEFSYLMLQENYMNTNPILANSFHGREKALKQMELVDKAAESISDGDLVDRMIHGSQQQWSLMPTHAVFSFVRPASFISGSMAGHKTGFTSWLGMNSKQGKLSRFVKEIQSHVRLKSSGDRHETRQQYIPMFWEQLVKKLERAGKEIVPEVIEFMDSYFLTKEDFDAILELGVGPMDQEKVHLESQTKATFTRLYNQQSHPLPFMKASNVVAPKKQSRDKPDLEEAIEESDEGEVVEETKDEDEEIDLSKDKYVKQPKKKAAPKKAAGKKRKSDVVDEEDDEDEDVKPAKKGKGKAGAGRGRPKKS
ncbi:MAG: hypothetical protein M1822_008442 [Bathelium mastoideum]|nr:MAG: hypothetical protein M1822_008442 [Bathelium mastoideum]